MYFAEYLAHRRQAMRILQRLLLVGIASMLAAASLPSPAVAQEAEQADEPGATFASPLADATWMKRYAPLDEDALSQQRGGAPGPVTVASTPQLMAGSGSVTLWDEIAPPAPMPIPVDAQQRAIQGNNASYTRK
jgi:hypothetical protein